MPAKRSGYPVFLPDDLIDRADKVSKLPSFPRLPGEKPNRSAVIRVVLRIGFEALEKGEGSGNGR